MPVAGYWAQIIQIMRKNFHFKRIMYKVKPYILILFLIMATNAMSQGRYCKNYDDFVAGKWEELPSIKIVHHSTSHQFWLGGSDYKVTSHDKKLAKLLKKEVLIVEYHDTLYVNLRPLRFNRYKLGSGYTRAVRIGGNKLAFFGKKNSMNMFLFFGVVGSAISEYSSVKNKVCYILDSQGDGKNYQVKKLDDSVYKDALLESER